MFIQILSVCLVYSYRWFFLNLETWVRQKKTGQALAQKFTAGHQSCPHPGKRGKASFRQVSLAELLLVLCPWISPVLTSGGRHGKKEKMFLVNDWNKLNHTQPEKGMRSVRNRHMCVLEKCLIWEKVKLTHTQTHPHMQWRNSLHTCARTSKVKVATLNIHLFLKDIVYPLLTNKLSGLQDNNLTSKEKSLVWPSSEDTTNLVVKRVKLGHVLLIA